MRYKVDIYVDELYVGTRSVDADSPEDAEDLVHNNLRIEFEVDDEDDIR